MGMRDRIRKRRAAKEPQQQYYGGSKEAYEGAQQTARAETEAGQRRINQGLLDIAAERDSAGEASQRLLKGARADQRSQRNQATAYGGGADQSLGDYRAGREALLGAAGNITGRAGGIDANAAAMEQIARTAPQQYQSAADAAYRASTERNQRNALALASGRGSGGLRTALATSGANNAQAALDQQVVRAQEMNQLLGMQGQLYQGAAGVRGQAANVVGQGAGVLSNVSAQDQQAAQIQAQRQQAATGASQAALGQQAAISAGDAALGMGAAGAKLGSGTGTRDAYLGSQNSMEIAQLGGNQAYELQRQAAARQNSPFQKTGSWLADPLNFRGAEAGKVM